MSETAEPHSRWEELVAGHVLGALNPGDAAALAQHLPGCPRCTVLAAELQESAASLAYLSETGPPPAAVWQRIRDDVETDLSAGMRQRPSRLAGALSSRQHRARALRRPVWAWAAAAVAGLLALSLGLAAHFDRQQPPALATCSTSPGCQVVKLTGSASTVTLLIRGNRAELVPVRLPAPPAGTTYVLWQLPKDGSPVGIAAFTTTTPASQPVLSVTLPRPLSDTTAFAISRETGQAIPAHPSTPLAVGTTGN